MFMLDDIERNNHIQIYTSPGDRDIDESVGVLFSMVFLLSHFQDILSASEE